MGYSGAVREGETVVVVLETGVGCWFDFGHCRECDCTEVVAAAIVLEVMKTETVRSG